jgi:hypothetical protein
MDETAIVLENNKSIAQICKIYLISKIFQYVTNKTKTICKICKICRSTCYLQNMHSHFADGLEFSLISASRGMKIKSQRLLMVQHVRIGIGGLHVLPRHGHSCTFYLFVVILVLVFTSIYSESFCCTELVHTILSFHTLPCRGCQDSSLRWLILLECIIGIERAHLKYFRMSLFYRHSNLHLGQSLGLIQSQED